MIKKMTEKTYWNSMYRSKPLECQQCSREKLKTLLKKLLGRKILEYKRNYADYLLWDVIYKKHMPKKTNGARLLEIGSAPGNYLVRLKRAFGFVPYGVEYSESGVELNREIFSLYNIDIGNVIYADFLSDEFHKQYKGYFDIVISRGFIEHFTDVGNIIKKHISLLTSGGYLIVSIPNIRGVNYILTWIFHKKGILMHNMDIMQKEKFTKLFDKNSLLTLFCDYYGTFNFGQFRTERNSPMRFVLNFCKKLQLILNATFRLIFKDKGMESRLFSPYLLFIGVKKNKTAGGTSEN